MTETLAEKRSLPLTDLSEDERLFRDQVRQFAEERVRITTPQPATPDAVAGVFAELLTHFPASTGPVGVTVPGVVRHGVVGSAASATMAPRAKGRDISSPRASLLSRSLSSRPGSP